MTSLNVIERFFSISQHRVNKGQPTVSLGVQTVVCPLLFFHLHVRQIASVVLDGKEGRLAVIAALNDMLKHTRDV